MAIALKLSIIIVSYNTKKLLDGCLASIKKSLSNSTNAYEIIVVDNGSSDGSYEMVKAQYPEVRLFKNQTNIGFGKANNIGIQKAFGKYILLLNSDIVVRGDAIDRLCCFIERHPKSFAGAKLINSDGSVQPSCGPFMNLPVIFVMLFLKGDKWGATRSSPNRIRKTQWVSGACLIGEKDAFINGLLFDEDIFMYMEEIDLLYRAAKKGFTTYFYPHAHFVHLGAASSEKKHKQPVLNIYRGLIYFYSKYNKGYRLNILRFLLKLKASSVCFIASLIGNKDLYQIYEEAYKLV